MGIRRLGLTCAFILCAQQLHSETLSCSNTNVSVDAPTTTLARQVCRVAEEATKLFAQCNMSFADRVDVNIVSETHESCLGVYHCDENRIDILTPQAMEALRKPTDAFGFLDVDQFFESVVVHELAHAALAKMRCPFDACIVANEYVAYTMQVMSLDEEQRIVFSRQRPIDRKISMDELSAMFLFLAPGRFAQRVWTHNQQTMDPCGYLGQVADGSILLDREGQF